MGIADALDAATNGGVEPDVYEQPTEAFEAVVEVEPDSVLAELRERVSRTDLDNTVTLELPYFGGLLWARYKPIPVGKVLRTSRPGVEVGLDPAIAADALATACVELLRTPRDGGGGDLIPLDPSGDVTRYDDGLVALLGLQPTQRTARAVVFSLFRASGRADALILQHAGQYIEWLTGQEAPVVEGEPLTG